MKNLVKLISTSFGVGYLPLIPGTAASCLAVLIYLGVKNNLYIYSLVLIACLILGYLVSKKAEEVFQKKDPSKVVIDEVAGMLLALWAVPFDKIWVIVGFIIFRALDMLKPYPADKIEKSGGGFGIMGDDLIAGLYTNIALQIAARVLFLWI